MELDGEISTFIMVWASIFTSAIYCFCVAKFAPKGLPRLLLFFPVICLFILLPFKLNTVHLGCPTFFFISWLANSKLILLAFDAGPLSNSSIPLIHFLLVTCFPAKFQENTVQTGENEKLIINHPLRCAKKAAALAILVFTALRRDQLHPKLLLFCATMYIYVGVDLMLSVVALIGEWVPNLRVEVPFDDPFRSTSLRDFWGRRWNKIASDNLRTAVFRPVYNYSSSKKMGKNRALIQGLMATFIVSALLHEGLIFHLGRRFPPSWRTAMFFIFHLVCLVVEGEVKRRLTGKWAVSKYVGIMSGPVIFGFVIATAMWLLVPDMLDYKVDERVVDEWIAFFNFFKGFVHSSKDGHVHVHVQ